MRRTHRPGQAMKNVSKERAAMDSPTSTTAPNRRVPRVALVALLFCLVLPGVARAEQDDFAIASSSSSVSTEAAGAHPEFTTEFGLTKDPGMGGWWNKPSVWSPTRDILNELPPGFVGNPSAFPKCSAATFLNQTALAGEFLNFFFGKAVTPLCSNDSQLGYVAPGIEGFGEAGQYVTPLWNLEAPKGEDSDVVARLGFYAAFYPIIINITVDPERDYALNAKVTNIPTIAALEGSITKFWADPTNSSHDFERENWYEAAACGGPCVQQVENETTHEMEFKIVPRPSHLPPTPFIANPTSCGPAEVTTGVRSYARPEGFDLSVGPLADFNECDAVPFEPTMTLAPTTKSPGASSGLDVDLHIPQEGLEDPEALVTSHLKDAVVKLPAGLALNASAADGLAGCSESQIGLNLAERQLVDLEGHGAPVRLSFQGRSTGTLPTFATPAEVQGALEGLPGIGTGNVSVSGRPGGPWTVSFIGALDGKDVPQVAGVRSEVQRVGVRATDGTFTIALEGNSTPSLPFDATPAEVQSALEGLPGIGAGQVEVRGDVSLLWRTRQYRITFTGGLAETDLPPVIADGSDLAWTADGDKQDTFATVYPVQEGGSAVQTETVKQGGTIGFNGEDPTCPDSSKVATGEIHTPFLEDPLEANFYLASQKDNPFGSLFAGYLVAKGDGALLKIPAEIEVAPETGQVTTVFQNNPQQPFEELELHFKGGNRGLLTTPDKCGTYESTYELTPWSGTETVKGTSGFTLDENCGQKPFAPGFHAGSQTALAGSFTTFITQVTNDAGAPALKGIDVNLPEGLSAKLAGVATCPDSALGALPTAPGTGQAQIASPSCPAASQIGTVQAGAGSGSPFYVKTGKVYLAGPYKGAPLSLAVLTPAVAGPFDLGNVLVRVPVSLDRRTARAYAASDPIPTMLSGIPLDLRDVRVLLDRQGFALNPTSCEPKSADGVITGQGGASANVSDRFQVGECAALGFKPKLTLRLKGGTKRGDHPALTAILRPRPGDANIGAITVALPHSEFLDQGHIGTVCTRVQFDADACPKASIYGKVTATTPLLEQPLSGNVYLRSSSNKLPDLVTDLRGPASLPIHLEADGRLDSVNGGIRSSFEFVPDAPLTKVVLKMKGAKKGLLQNSRDICAAPSKASASFAAHNGRTLTAAPPLEARCKGKAAKKAKGKRNGKRRG
jgi:hypothetical protein